MSYSLMVIDFDEIPTLAELHEHLAASEGDVASGVHHAPTEKLTAFFHDVAEHFPSLEQDAANSPWSTTPTLGTDLAGKALSFGIGKMDLLFDVLMEFEELAWRHDLILFDPQDGSLRKPRDE